MTPLTLVLHQKVAFEISPYDSTQTAALGAGTGAVLGGTAAGLGTYFLGPKGKKRTSNALKAALIGALGAGAYGGYTGYNYGKGNLDKAWNSAYKGRLGENAYGDMAAIKENNGGVRDLYLAARKKLDGTNDMSVEQFERLQDDTPGLRLGLIPWTAKEPTLNTTARASEALKERFQDSMKRNITATPGELLSSLWSGKGHPAINSEVESDLAPDMKWLKGEGESSKQLVDRLIGQYQH